VTVRTQAGSTTSSRPARNAWLFIGTETPFTEYNGSQRAFDRTVAGMRNAHQNHVKMAFSTDADYYIPGMDRGQVVIDRILRNGDLIELGSAQLRFWFARTRQKTLRLREALTWIALVMLFGTQIGLIYLLRIPPMSPTVFVDVMGARLRFCPLPSMSTALPARGASLRIGSS